MAANQNTNASVHGATQQQLFYVSDPSVSGTLILLAMCLAVLISSFALFEGLRHKKVFAKLYYTRIESSRKEAPDVPEKIFGWITLALYTPESFFVEKVGLDAAMFLRYLHMSFFQFLTLSVTVTPILVMVNYFSSSINQDTSEAMQLSELGLFRFSISNVPSGSPSLIAHAFFVVIVTFSTFYNLFHGYKNYAILSNQYLREDPVKKDVIQENRPPWRANEALQLRTVLVQNIPKQLRSGESLTNWFQLLGIGDVDIAILDRSNIVAMYETKGKNGKPKKKNAQKLVGKLLEERNKALYHLEKAYLQWAKNIDNARLVIKMSNKKKNTFQRLWLMGVLWMKTGSTDGESSLDITTQQLDGETVQKLRPTVKWFFKSPFTKNTNQELQSNSAADAIEFYTEKLNELTAMVQCERIKALDSDAMKEEYLTQSTASAFVTFKTQRSAQIAVQVLLYSSFNRHKMKMSLAPAPQDVLWPAISLNPIQRQIQSYIVNVVCIGFTFFWIVPASFFATLTNLDTLANMGAFHNAIFILSKNEQLYLFLKTIGPPLVVNVFNIFIPYIFEFISLINSVAENPAVIFTLLGETLPTGATFFINYIIVDTVFFGIELLRPTILIWNALCKISDMTPRQIHEMNLYTSYLNFGILYPMPILIFVIGLLYSVIAPLIMIPTTLYFGLGYMVYRNQLLFVYVKEWEAYGKHWAKAFTRIIIGLIIFQITMVGMFFIKG
ncbi:hypothetical protein HDU83_001421, partial [Entophlyctis luteolus]